MLRSASSSFGSVNVGAPLIQPKMRIGVMGGTFNPPHPGHALISRTALRRLDLDQLWWVVTPGNPLKNNNGLPEQSIRMDECRVLANDVRMRVTGFEAALDTPYTAMTLAYLVQRYRDVQFVWIMGADNLAGFHRWQDWKVIANLMPFAVVDRPGWRLKSLASPAAHVLRSSYVPEAKAGLLANMDAPAWTFLTGPLSRLSSTALRQAARQVRANRLVGDIGGDSA